MQRNLNVRQQHKNYVKNAAFSKAKHIYQHNVAIINATYHHQEIVKTVLALKTPQCDDFLYSHYLST